MKKKFKHYWDGIEPIAEAISIYDGPKVFLKQFQAVDSWRADLFAAHWCQSEICNGGFMQFFDNHTGVLAPEAHAAFERIGLPELAELLRQAMNFFGTKYPRDEDLRTKKLETYLKKHPNERDPFDALNTEFYRQIENDRFEKKANEYANTFS